VTTSRAPQAAIPAGSRPTDPAVQALQRHTLSVVIAAQVLGGAGLAAGVTVGGLLAQDMLGDESIAGLPSGAFTLGSAIAAFSVGRLSQRAGRRLGLAAGFLTGAVGAAGIVLAAVIESPVLLFAALVVYGSGTATNLQARYAGTDLASTTARATAASLAMVATTLGAVAGPNLVGPLGGLAHALGVPRLAGPFMLATLAYGAAGIVLYLFLKPDPLLVARTLTADQPGEAEIPPSPTPATPAMEETRARALRTKVAPGVILGATVMVLTQATMTAIMTMTPIHMRHHHHSLDAVGLVISLHIAAMYLPSLVTGRLVDKVGRLPTAIAAALILLASGIAAAVAPPMSMGLITLALILLGLGWNLGLISGTALIVDSTPMSTRAKTQGTVDVLVALAGASGAAVSGVIVSLTGFGALALGFGIAALALIPVALLLTAGPETRET
jgi:MFS family permease